MDGFDWKELSMNDSGQDLTIDLHKQMNKLIVAVRGMKKIGRLLTKYDREYKEAERAETFFLHDKRSVAWTACRNLALGQDDVKDLKYKRDRCQYAYESQLELIYAIKTFIRIYETEIKQDWGQSR